METIDRGVEGTQSGVDISWIDQRIALGACVETEQKMQAVARAGITHIIDMSGQSNDALLAQPYGIEVLVNATEDDFQYKSPKILEQGVDFALAALQEPATKLLIHCLAGRHRGPMMALALLCVLGWSLDEAMQRISERRSIVDWAPVYVDSVAQFVAQYVISTSILAGQRERQRDGQR